MKEKELSMDEVRPDTPVLCGEAAPEKPVAQQKDTAKKKKKHKKKKALRKFGVFLGKLLLVVLETALLLVIALYGVMFVLAKGPSPTARDLFVMSARETSAMGWLPNLYFTEEEISQIENRRQVEDYIETDTSLIQIPKETEGDNNENLGPQPDEWGLIDEDGDGLILQNVKGEGYSGYMLVVLDPSRVIMGSVPSSYRIKGYTVEEMVKEFDAVAGINAGGFFDPEGRGNGSIPDSMVVVDGEVYYENGNSGIGVKRVGFVGFDSNHIMHVGTRLTADDVREWDIQYGVTFGPVLISNGEPCDVGTSGVNPRTAIGQRSDGAVLLLIVDGRQVVSLGATLQDLIDIMMDYGAVNACNLDGGSSTMMYLGDGYVNHSASIVGIRPVPTTFLVLKEGVKDNG